MANKRIVLYTKDGRKELCSVLSSLKDGLLLKTPRGLITAKKSETRIVNLEKTLKDIENSSN